MSSDAIDRLNAALSGRYRIERELGEGGMATVYLADDVKHERKVALKVLKPELAAVVGAERFLAEIKTTANLTHPHILPLFDSGEADSFLFYVMPFVEGPTLRSKLEREKQLGIEEAVDIAKTEPPPDTRARMRGEFIKLARENSIQYDLDWSNIRLGNLLNVRVICNNPFESDTEKVAELVRTIQKTNLRKTSLSKLVIQS